MKNINIITRLSEGMKLILRSSELQHIIHQSDPFNAVYQNNAKRQLEIVPHKG